MLSIDEARTRIARGAAHLDFYMTGWHNHIDVGTLDLETDCGCVIGQLCGSYTRCDPWWLSTEVIGCDEADLGFHILRYEDPPGHPFGHPDWRILQDAWIEAIADRRLAQEKTQPQTEAVCVTS